METPPPDPQKLLTSWMEWETGETPPGRVMSNLKIAGLPDLLRALVEAATAATATAAAPASTDE
jgi:hypothetical protein